MFVNLPGLEVVTTDSIAGLLVAEPFELVATLV
jgi:hypothetical protein